MVLQNFDVKLDDPNYQPVIKQNLTVKPDELYIRVTPRKDMDATTMDQKIHSKGQPNDAGIKVANREVNGEALEHPAGTKPMTILYGSNTGTCQAFAQRLASEASSRGFSAEVKDMDSATNAVPSDRPVIIITSSYEGQPPDNAARFVEWLHGCDVGSLSGVQFTVFGCGHRK